jgi:hypothetical protein
MLAAVGAALLAPAQVYGPPDASAAASPPPEKRSAESGVDSVSPKTVTAVCPAGKWVVGGGGWATTTAIDDETRVLLTRLEPVHSGNLDAYTVTAEEVAPGMSGSWSVEAYVVCAAEPAGYEIVSGSTAPSSVPVQESAADCPGSKRILGTGVQINNPGGQVTLQTNRSSSPRNVRAVAKEDANGYAAEWHVTVYAICANPTSGLDSFGNSTVDNGTVDNGSADNGSALTGSEDSKIAFSDCPDGTYVYGAGVATSGTPPGLTTTPPGIAVQAVYPFNDLRSVQVVVVATTPTSLNWDVDAFAICGP